MFFFTDPDDAFSLPSFPSPQSFPLVGVQAAGMSEMVGAVGAHFFSVVL